MLLDISLCAWLSIWPPPEELGPEEAAASKKTQARARKITARKTAGLLQSFSLASRIMIVLYCLCAGAQNMVQLSLPGLSRALPGLSRASSEAIANLRSRFVAEELPPPQPLPLPTRKHRLFLGAWRGSTSPANRRRLFVMAERIGVRCHRTGVHGRHETAGRPNGPAIQELPCPFGLHTRLARVAYEDDITVSSV